jgi:hypothetical protein
MSRRVVTAGGVEHFDAFGLVETGQGSRRGIVAFDDGWSLYAFECRVRPRLLYEWAAPISEVQLRGADGLDAFLLADGRVVPIPGFDPDEWKDDQSAVFRVRYRNGANMARISSEKICGSSQAAKWPPRAALLK